MIPEESLVSKDIEAGRGIWSEMTCCPAANGDLIMGGGWRPDCPWDEGAAERLGLPSEADLMGHQ